MDFTLTREQEMLQNMVREFAEKELAPRASTLDERGEFPWDIVKRMKELGLIAMPIPKEYGGGGMSYLSLMMTVEEIARVYPPIELFHVTNEEVMFMLRTAGTEEQKRKYLLPMVQADKIGFFAVTEATGGSDPTTTQTTATEVDEGYSINGRKVFASLGGVANMGLFLAKAKGGLSLFVVEKGTPGFEVGRRESVSGFRCIPINELIFTDCRIPKENLIGAEGEGLRLALTDFTLYARPGMVGLALGIAKGAYEAALKFAKERRLYGAPIADLQAIQFMLADMEVEVEAAKWLYYRLVWLIDQGKSSREVAKDTAIAKVYVVEAANKNCLKAIQILGGYGVTLEYQVVCRLHDALACLAAGGTNEIMRVAIGREITR